MTGKECKRKKPPWRQRQSDFFGIDAGPFGLIHPNIMIS
jgi:hypothetical protein